METGIYCIWCGSELAYMKEYTVCLGCGTIFTGISFSRIPGEEESNIVDEIDITIESIKYKTTFERSPVFQTTPKVEYAEVKG